MGEANQQGTLRLFAAVELSDGARRAAASHAALLRARLPQGLKAGWEREEKLHLTLKFFGDVEAARTGELAEALARAAAASRRFPLRLGRAGVFPGPARPSILWLGLEDASGELARLHARVEDECAALGFPRERRPFHPHVTLARLRTASREARALARQHLELAFAPVNFEVFEIVLISSRLGPGGSVYTALSRHDLGVGSVRPADPD